MTKQERRALEQALHQAIEQAGGPTELAEFISKRYEPITKQAISGWTICPPRRAVQIAAAVRAKGGRISAQELRPDLFEPIAA